MARVIILGSASAVPTAQNENTHMLVQTGERCILIDCPGSPVVRLEQVGISINEVTDVILTHFHPDHVSGFAPLLMSMWLLGRKQPLTVYGLDPTIERAVEMMKLYDWENWPNFYPVIWVRVPAQEHAVLIEDGDPRVYASPVDHLVPTIGLRFEMQAAGRVVTYSCDTEPSQVVVRLAHGSDVLIHEATGSSKGHTSPEQAGEIATQAGAQSLYLVHYPPNLVTPESLLARARQTFRGRLVVASDLMEVDLG